MKLPIKEIIVRGVTFPIGALLSALTSWLIIGKLGLDTFSNYSIVLGLLAFLTFLDVGGGARCVAVSGEFFQTKDLDKFERSLAKTMKTQLVVISWLAPLAVVLAIAVPSQEIPFAFLIFGILLLSQPLSIYSKILVGFRKTHIWFLFQLLGSVVSLGLVYVFSELDHSEGVLLVPLAVAITSNLASSIFATKISGSSLIRILQVSISSKDLGSSFSTLWSQRHLAAISLFMAGAYASDRVLISFLGDTSQIASFSLTSQVFAPGFAILSAAGMGIWSYFASLPTTSRNSYRLSSSAKFCAIGAIVSIPLLIVLPHYLGVVSQGLLSLDWALAIWFSLYLVVQSAQYPLGYFMMHNGGDARQSLYLLLAFALKVPVALCLWHFFELAGLIISNLVLVLCIQLLPGLLHLNKKGHLRW
jgi:hypothetical protein